MKLAPLGTLALFLLLGPVACQASQEAARVDVAVVVDTTGLTPATSDLGWRVSVDELRCAVAEVRFTVAGELHARAPFPMMRMQEALAHPGHYAGGEVTGELPGRHVLDWAAADGAPLGTAVLLEGDYNGANLAFVRANTVDDGLGAGDPLLGHACVVRGSATQGATTIGFDATLDIEDGALVVGAPLDFTAAPGATATLGLRALLEDPTQDDGPTVFDGVDFEALPQTDGRAVIAPGDADHNRLIRAFVKHDFYDVTVRSTPP